MASAAWKIFVGSSSEAKLLAGAVTSELSDLAPNYPHGSDLKITNWQHTFKIGEGVYASLLKAIQEFDFGIFTFYPDEVNISRGTQANVACDNVIFELGLFTGALGPGRTFVVAPREDQVRRLTDLKGITCAEFTLPSPVHDDDELRSAVNGACRKILTQIEKLLEEDEVIGMRAEERAHSRSAGDRLWTQLVVDMQRGILEHPAELREIC